MKYKKLLVCALLVLGLSVGIQPVDVHANVADLTTKTGCSELPSYTGQVDLAAGGYDVYARLAKRGDQAQVTGYSQVLGNYGECQQLGPVNATGDRWTKIGSFTASDEQTYVLQLSSESLAELPDANRPTVMLVPQASPVCVPDVECNVTVQGQTGYIRPTGTLLNQDSLHVLKIVNPATDTIKIVNYYVDDKLAYSSPTLEAFDLRYVANDKQTATAIVQYESGQRVVIPQTLPELYIYENPLNMAFRAYKATPLLPRILVLATGLLIVGCLTLFVVDRLHRRRLWEDRHGFTGYEESHYTDAQRHFIQVRDRVLGKVKPIVAITVLVIGVVTIIASLNAYAAQIFVVDGHSMESTYHNGKRVVINKLPQTWAHLNRLEYKPERGDVVVVRGVFGDTTTTLEDTVTLHLIKRVIGLPGEHVVIADGHVTIYNKANPAGFDPDQGSAWQKTMHPNLKTEKLDIQLSESEIFLSGDNRPESIDSRFNGPIRTKEIVGQVVTKGI